MCLKPNWWLTVILWKFICYMAYGQPSHCIIKHIELGQAYQGKWLKVNFLSKYQFDWLKPSMVVHIISNKMVFPTIISYCLIGGLDREGKCPPPTFLTGGSILLQNYLKCRIWSPFFEKFSHGGHAPCCPLACLCPPPNVTWDWLH